MSTQTQISVTPDSVWVARGSLPSEMDVSTREQVLMLATSILSGHQRADLQIAQTAHELVSLKGFFANEREFHQFCTEAFGWHRSRVYRYLKIGEVVWTHWLVDKTTLHPALANMSGKIFTMLDGDTAPEVIQQ
ncbi:hypothetical protein VSR34_21745 [Paraburkholderia sp. JHI2823]|uniref:hypothetical protein n=1 Tax=Paraburkholderia sp. JHI2823 TaxID=3112960 RepID=UPI00317FC3A8